MKTAVILGAGITGLAAAWKLSEAGFSVRIIEKDGQIGGMSSSIRIYDSVLDLGPHKIYSKLPVLEDVKELLKDDLQVIPKYSRIRLFGKYFDYPLRIPQLILGVSPLTSSSMIMSYACTSVKGAIARPQDANYEEYMINRFGNSLYNKVFKSYAEKAWDEPKALDASLAKSRIALPSLFGLVKAMLSGKNKMKDLHAEEFHYPKEGIALFSERMLEKALNAGAKIYLNSSLHSIEPMRGFSAVHFRDADGRKLAISADYVVSTIPPKDLLALLPAAPQNVSDAVAALKCRSLALLYLKVKKERLFRDNWIFFPERKYIFNRLSEQKGFSSKTVPVGMTVLCVEITSPEKDTYDNEVIFRLATAQLEECGILRKEEIDSYHIVRIENAYPIYSIGYRENVITFLSYLDTFGNIMSIGRQGMFNYVGMIDCVDMGFKAALHIASGAGIAEWKRTREDFFNYVTID